MKELTLEHLAKRLPYNVVLRYTKDGKPFRGTKRNEILTIQNIELLMFSQFRLPVLRPLDLAKEIEHNGEIINPRKEIERSYQNWIYNWDCDIMDQMDTCPKWIHEKLLEWHFDTDGLIEAGLAIDVNTLDENPYK